MDETFHQKQLELSQKLQETTLCLSQKQRLLTRWKLGAGFIVFLALCGVVGIFFNGNWGILLFFTGFGAVIYLIAFFNSECGKDTLTDAWKLQDEEVALAAQQRLLEETWTQQILTQEYPEYYRHVIVPSIIEDYQRHSRISGYFHLVLQMTVIIASLLVTGFTSGLDTKIGLPMPWIAPILSFIVSLCTAVMGFFKFRERSFHMQQTADAIEQETTAFVLGIRHYKGIPHPQAFSEFAERVEHLREEQRKRQQQLEQSSESKETASSS